jgi:hypothetical protein
MAIFSSLKQDAINFLEPYKIKDPATYAAAEQAIGAILITDGFIGISNPFAKNKRSGIFGTIGGMVLGVIFMLIPTFFGNITGINQMTAATSATVVSVGQPVYSTTTNSNSSSRTAACSLSVSYTVNGQTYTNPSSFSSSDNCSLVSGQIITINYNPTNPGSWAYGAKTIGTIFQVFFWAGVLVLISSIITFFIRLFSIIFGWKLLRDGRKNAASLPPGTNIETMINEIKQNFTSSIFGFGGSGQNVPTPPNIPN